MTEPPVYVAILDLYKVPFASEDHARAVVAEWNAHHAPAVARLREEDCNKLADDLIGRIEEWEHDKWAWEGPGGMAAVWSRVPDRQYVHSLWFSCNAQGKTVNEGALFSRWAWEFQTDSYTTREATSHVEYRPGMHAITEARAKGVDLAAVQAAFAEAKVEALQTCANHPDADFAQR